MNKQDNIRTYFWSRCPGKYVECKTGYELKTGKGFSGSIQEWYENLPKLIVQVMTYENILSDAKIKVSYETRTILQHTRWYDHSKKELSDAKVSLKKDTKNNIHQIEIYKRNKHIATICVLDLNPSV